MSGWIKVEEALPIDGEHIVGFAYCEPGEPGAHGVWDEIWDDDEPIGSMTHWIHLPEPLLSDDEQFAKDIDGIAFYVDEP